jgi:hypothetical protein
MTMGVQIPVISEKPQTACTITEMITKLDSLGNYLCNCTDHSGAKKEHDWVVDQLADLFYTTHKVKTQKVVKRRGQDCGDVDELDDLFTK